VGVHGPLPNLSHLLLRCPVHIQRHCFHFLCRRWTTPIPSSPPTDGTTSMVWSCVNMVSLRAGRATSAPWHPNC
jgi:hypothetical protein